MSRVIWGNWESLLAGRSRAARITSLDASGHPCHVGAELKGFNPQKFFPRKKSAAHDVRRPADHDRCLSGDRARRFAPLQINTREDEAGDFYEEKRLIQAGKSGTGGGAASAETIQEVLLKDIHQFVGAGDRSDDITLVVLSREPDA